MTATVVEPPHGDKCQTSASTKHLIANEVMGSPGGGRLANGIAAVRSRVSSSGGWLVENHTESLSTSHAPARAVIGIVPSAKLG